MTTPADPRPATPVLRLPCTDDSAANLFAAHLLNEGVDVAGTDGKHVLVPTDNPTFAWDVAEEANEQGFAHDDEVCAAVGRFLTAVTR